MLGGRYFIDLIRGESNSPRFLSAPFTVFLALVFVRRHITSDETRKNEKFIFVRRGVFNSPRIKRYKNGR